MHLSFGDRVKEYHNSRKNNSLIESRETLSPSPTNEESSRKLSSFSCGDSSYKEQQNLLSNTQRDKYCINSSNNDKAKAYLQKSKNYNMNNFSPISKLSNSVNSILE
mmetsp:Transcript_36940/g.36547  ORF Transcript_36940/g.36547 Transcript_36940/m.36547 type:complete len:107 (-) Transcript_36940:444-764(-)